MADTSKMLTISVKGLPECLAKLMTMPEDIRRAFRNQVIQSGMIVEASAKDNCPVDTGRLRASITTNWSGSNMARAVITKPAKETETDDAVGEPSSSDPSMPVVVVGTNVKYAPDVEYLTERKHNVGRAPFLYPAFAENQDRILEKVTKAVQVVLDAPGGSVK